MKGRTAAREAGISHRDANSTEAEVLVSAADAIAQVAAEMGYEQYLLFGLSREPEREIIGAEAPRGAVIAAQEREMASAARSLHDDSIQSLACALVELETTLGDAGLEQGQRDSIASAIDHLDEALKGILELSRALHPEVIDQLGLTAALRSLVKGMNATSRIDFKLVSIGKEGDVPDEIKLNLYRIAQEALRNVAAHSGAREALVCLCRSDRGIDLAISDDGGGVSGPVTDAGTARLGLASMREWAEGIGASFCCRSDHRGVVVKVHVPLAR